MSRLDLARQRVLAAQVIAIRKSRIKPAIALPLLIAACVPATAVTSKHDLHREEQLVCAVYRGIYIGGRPRTGKRRAVRCVYIRREP